MIRKILAVAALIVACPVWGATYYVSVSGSDSYSTAQAQSESTPWRTIQKSLNNVAAGDTVIIKDGSYYENCEFSAAGTEENPITLKAENRGGAVNPYFNIDQPYYIIEGIAIRGYQGTQSDMVRIPRGGDYVTITNCDFGPSPYLYTNDVTINSTAQTIYKAGVNWGNLGFRLGGRVWLGFNTETNAPDSYIYDFANKARSFVISSIGGSTLGLTGTWEEEDDVAPWVAIYAGSGKDGITAIGCVSSTLGGTVPTAGPQGLTVTGCTFTNLFGDGIGLSANMDTVISNNIFDGIIGYHWIVPYGTNTTVIDNFYINGILPLYASVDEVSHFSHSSDGLAKYDWIVGQIHSQGANPIVNCLFKRNWLQNIHNQFSQLGRVGSGFTFSENVCVGVSKDFNGGVDDYNIIKNTFYKCVFDSNKEVLIPIQNLNGINVYSNIFLDLGTHANTNLAPWNPQEPYTDFNHDYNYAANAESLGYSGYQTFDDVNGINGGNPYMTSPTVPLGADGLPFTEDDGLRPLAWSPLAAKGIGALAPANPPLATQPIASFSAQSPEHIAPNDAVGEAYDPDWVAADFWTRTNLVKPWDVAEALGHVPVAVMFDARTSISGDWSTNSWYGINSYAWDFGDGASVVTCQPTNTHTFLTPGTYTVTLRLTNQRGYSHTASRAYRILDVDGFSGHIYHVAVTGDDSSGTGTYENPWATIQKAADSMIAGDYAAVHAGDYDEKTVIDNTIPVAGNPAHIIGYGAKTGSFSIEAGHWRIRGFELDVNPSAAYSAFWFRDSAPNTDVEVSDCLITGTPSLGSDHGFYFQASSRYPGPTQGWTDIVLANNTVTNAALGFAAFSIANGSNILCSANRILNTTRQSDGYRIAGANITVQDGFVYNVGRDGTGNHSDAMQIPTPTLSVVKDILIQRMWFQGVLNNPTPMAVAQMASGRFDNANYKGLKFRNCVWVDVPDKMSDSLDGIDFKNCTIYRSVTGNTFLNTGGDYADILASLTRVGTTAYVVSSVPLNIGPAPQVEIYGTGDANFDGFFTLARTDLSHYTYTVADSGLTTAPGTPTLRGIRGSSLYQSYTNNAFVGLHNDDNPSGGWYYTAEGTIWDLYTEVAGDYNFVTGINDVAKQEAGGLTGPEYWGSAGREANGINGGSPGFADVANLNLQLLESSQMYEAGANLSEVFQDDFFGRPRPSAGAWNIGAFTSSYDAELPSDVTPPIPNPSTWAVIPSSTSETSVIMTATTATDAGGGPVEYYFDETTGAGNDSGWQSSAIYADTGLTASTTYTYRVRARDLLNNLTDWSTSLSVTTDEEPPGPDLDPPTPDPLTWSSVPAAAGLYSITMTATTATDAANGPVEYYFDETTGAGHDSGWVSAATYVDVGLVPSTTYTYRVRARDQVANVTAWSSSEDATTDSEPVISGNTLRVTELHVGTVGDP